MKANLSMILIFSFLFISCEKVTLLGDEAQETQIEISKIQAVDQGFWRTKMLISLDENYYDEILDLDFPLRRTLKKGVYPIDLTHGAVPKITRAVDNKYISIHIETISGFGSLTLFVNFKSAIIAKNAYTKLLRSYHKLSDNETLLAELKNCSFSIYSTHKNINILSCDIKKIQLD